jgi:DNA-binding SARP family transcriptional activator
MQFRILGSMAVRDGARRVSLPGGRRRALLALLVLHAGEAVSAERLIDELWGERPPATASTVVQGLVSKLRKTLEPRRDKGEPPAILRTVANGYLLAIEPDAVDANRFKRLLDESRIAAVAVRSAMLADALHLWHGPALADFTYEPFAQRAIAALEELRLTAIEDRIDADLALGRHGELVAEIEELTEAHPFRERLRAHLMLALYRAGRQEEALEAYQHARGTLVEELGIEPGSALRELEQAILRQDPSLALRPRADPSAEVTEAAEPTTHWLPRERRMVTLVAADLAVSSEPGVDPEAVARFTARPLDVARDVLRRYGARVEEVVGDMVLGFFGLPIAHEDDAVRVVRAAVELRAAIAALNERPVRGIRFSMRAGIETGDVVVGGTSPLRAGASGQVVTATSRLQQAADEGDVIVGAATQRLIRGAAVLKPAGGLARGGAGGTVPAWRVLDVVSGAPAVARHLDAPMCGRQAELTRLRTAFRRTVRSGSAHRFTILGEAGIGKSRLAKEFAESIGSDARIITGRCPAYGEGITFLPLREAMLEAAGARGWRALTEVLEGEDDTLQLVDQVAGGIGLTPQQGRPDELFRRARVPRRLGVRTRDGGT